MHLRILSIATIALAASTLWAGPKFNFNEGQSSLEITQTYQLWGRLLHLPTIRRIPILVSTCI